MITIITRLPSLAPNMEPTNRMGLMERFEVKKVRILTRRKSIAFSENAVRVVHLDTNQEESIKADWFIIALGLKPVDALIETLEGQVPELYCAGDCNKPRVILEAIYEGSLAGRQI